MLYSYAIQPEFIANLDILGLVYSNFGISKGRLISDYPHISVYPENDYLTRVYKLGNEKYDNTDHLLFVELMNEISAMTIENNLNYDTNISTWLENAELNQDHFKNILAETNPRSHAQVLSGKTFFLAPKFQVACDKKILRTGKVIASHVESLIKISKHIKIVDPYFSPLISAGNFELSRFLDVLNEILLSGQDNEPKEWEYHLNYENHKDDKLRFKKACEGVIKPILTSGSSFTFVRWEEVTDNDQLHPRYLLTERGGISIDFGFDRGDPGTKTDIRLISDELRRDRLKDYSEGRSPFRHFDKIVIE